MSLTHAPWSNFQTRLGTEANFPEELRMTVWSPPMMKTRRVAEVARLRVAPNAIKKSPEFWSVRVWHAQTGGYSYILGGVAYIAILARHQV